MRHRFESIHKSLDLGHYASFRDGKFQTDDDAVAKKVRAHAKAHPNEIWEEGQRPEAVNRETAPEKPEDKGKHKHKHKH